MASAAPFPSVDTGAMTAAASKLQSVAGNMSDTSTNVSLLQQAVTGNEAWKGQGATQWQTVMTSRVADADLSNETLSKGGTLLGQLASDLEGEQQYYNKVNGEMGDLADSFNPRFNPAPPDWDEPYISAMNASVTRANNLLKSFGDDCLSLAALADDVTAATAANRTPGEPDGPEDDGAKGTILATLAGTVTGGDSGTGDSGGSGITDNGFEETVLAELGLSKNNTTVGRDLNTEPGKVTTGGQPKGTIPDALADGPNGYVVEIKGYDAESVSARFQIRLGSLYAQANNLPYYVVVPKDAKVSSTVLRLAQRTGGDVISRNEDGTYEDSQGNPVVFNKATGKFETPQGTTPGSSDGSPGTSGTSGDPQAPAEPVNPTDTTGQPAAGSGDTGGDGGDTGGVGGGDPDPEVPFVDPLP
jgi:hypothetical protein